MLFFYRNQMTNNSLHCQCMNMNVEISHLWLLLCHPGELGEQQPYGVLHGSKTVGTTEAQQLQYELV